MRGPLSKEFEIVLLSVQEYPPEETYQPITLTTNLGAVQCRYYPAAQAQVGVIWVGGVGGGWDSPAAGLYPQLCQELQGDAVKAVIPTGIASLRIRYRYSTILAEAIADVLVGLSYLQQQGIRAVALVGHSFGGAVVIQAAASSAIVKTVVTLATQSYGAIPVAKLGPQCSILLLHGTADNILTPLCSEHIYEIAQEPKHLVLYPGASHSLNEVATGVRQMVRGWILEYLKSA